MINIVGLMFFLQLMLMAMAIMNLVIGVSSALTDKDLDTAKYYWFWAIIEGLLSLLLGFISLGLLR